jgi:2-polyprenyl-3-methyl-5-hydroxy-6-metoxy-1,4-benzoquinol methylase
VTEPLKELQWVGCPICTEDHSKEWFQKNGYSIVACTRCGVRYVNPRPRPDQLAAFYRREYVAGVPADSPATPHANHRPMKLATARLRLALIREFRDKTLLLDVGCGGGFFVQAATEAGWRAVGMDVSLQGHEPTRLVLAHAEEAPFRNGQFGVMTAYDVLEHVFCPRTFLTEAHRLLAPGGILLIETPNMAGWLPRLLGSKHPFVRPPDHLTFFTASTLSALLEQTGFRVERLQTSAQKVLTPAYVLGLTVVTNPVMTAIIKTVLSNFSSLLARSFQVPMDMLVAVARA